MAEPLAVSSPPPSGNGNAAWLGLAQASRVPDRVALVIDGQRMTYAQLTARADAFASGLLRAGFQPGDRIALLAPPTVDFFALALAIFAQGMVVVLVDGKMGLKRMMGALDASNAKAIVSIHKALRLWPVLRPLWKMKRYSVDQLVPGVSPLDELVGPGGAGEPIARRADDQALISFTSGTTGRAKGADRTHGVLVGQHEALAEHIAEPDDGVEMSFFPAVVLHGLALGLTNVLPPVDLRNPAACDPAAVLSAMNEHRVTRLWVAPAALARLVDFAAKSGAKVPSWRSLIVGGAPVSRKLCRQLGEVFPDVHAHVTYGSTEAEPMGGVDAREAARAVGEGLLVGKPAAAAEIALLRAAPPHQLGPLGVAPYLVANGEAGEVVVRGPHVNQRYVDNPEADRQNKLRAADGSIWHRTGDVARRDADGRLWLLSRLPDTVIHKGRPVYPLGVEDALASLAGVARAALIAHASAPEGEIVVELVPGAGASDTLAAVRASLLAQGLADLPVTTVPRIPVDLRHQSKIDRNALVQLRTPRRRLWSSR